RGGNVVAQRDVLIESRDRHEEPTRGQRPLERLRIAVVVEEAQCDSSVSCRVLADPIRLECRLGMPGDFLDKARVGIWNPCGEPYLPPRVERARGGWQQDPRAGVRDDNRVIDAANLLADDFRVI